MDQWRWCWRLCIFGPWIADWWALDCVWNASTLQVHSCTWHCTRTWPIYSISTASVSCINWLRYHLSILTQRQKTAWSVWQPLPELTLPLQLLSSPNPTKEIIRTNKNNWKNCHTALWCLWRGDYNCRCCQTIPISTQRMWLWAHAAK